ncbi:hypothetical protein RCL1_002605 [Eukaryota sp. TZLM3-RCL]
MVFPAPFSSILMTKSVEPYFPGDPRVGGLLANRFLILLSGFIIELIAGMVVLSFYLIVGSLYGISVFSTPLKELYPSWITAMSSGYSLAFLSLSFCPVAGRLIDRFSPRFTALCSSLLWTFGHLLCAFFIKQENKALFILSYGLVAGLGISFAYVSPVSSCVLWFPERRGLAGGICLSGFGFGGSLCGILVTRLIEAYGPAISFVFMAIGGGLIIALCASIVKKPPPGYYPANSSDTIVSSVQSQASASISEALKTAAFWKLFFSVLGCAFSAASLMSQTAPMLGIFGKTNVETGPYITFFSIINMSGRFLWPCVTDVMARRKIQRKWLLVFLLLGQIIASLSLLYFLSHQLLWGFLLAGTLLLWGLAGSLGSLPSIVSEIFGVKFLATLHGLSLVAWSLAGTVGSRLISLIKELNYGKGVEQQYLYHDFFKYSPILLVVSLFCAITLSRVPGSLPVSETPNEEEMKIIKEVVVNEDEEEMKIIKEDVVNEDEKDEENGGEKLSSDGGLIDDVIDEEEVCENDESPCIE